MRDRAFVEALSLIAALEAFPSPDVAPVLPHLGMARAELVDFGQRRASAFVHTRVVDVDTGLADLGTRLSALLDDSEVLQHSLRLEAALRWVHRAITARHDVGERS